MTTVFEVVKPLNDRQIGNSLATWKGDFNFDEWSNKTGNELNLSHANFKVYDDKV